MSRQKKVLIVTTLAPPAFGGTPTILGRYLRLFPKNSYFFLADPLTKSTPHVSKLLPCKYYFFDGTLLDGTRASGTKLIRQEKKKEDESRKVRPQKLEHLIYKLKFLRYVFFDFFQLIKTVGNAYKVGLDVIKKEKPNHILAVTDSGPSFIVSYLLSKKTKVPYSIFLFDIYKGNKFAPARIPVATALDKKIITNARKVFAAGEGIGEYYQKLYGKTCITIANSCEIPAKVPMARQVKLPMKIVYAGAYYWAQEEAIERVRSATKKLPWVKFDLYSHDAKARGHSGVSFRQSIRLQREADAILVPLSFSTGVFSEVIRTAPTGKLVECLVSGTPIVVHAPKDAWISGYIRKHKAGLVVDEPSEEAIRKSLAKLKDNKLRTMFVRNAFALAKKNHDLKKNSRLLYSQLFD